MLTLYDYLPSQNAYKVRLLLSQLKLSYRSVYVSIFEGEGQSEEYLKISPTGAVPALALPDGRVLAESNAILAYLADDTQFFPADRFKRAKVLQWLFFEGEQVQSTVATLRHWVLTGKDKRRSSAVMESKRAGTAKTLGILDRALASDTFLAGADYTIADISVFSYVHRSDEAGFALTDYPNVKRWVEEVRSQPDFVTKVYPYSIDPHSAQELAW